MVAATLLFWILKDIKTVNIVMKSIDHFRTFVNTGGGVTSQLNRPNNQPPEEQRKQVLTEQASADFFRWSG